MWTAAMIEVMIAFGVVALVVAAVLRRTWMPRRRATPPTRTNPDPWLTQAAELAQTGHQLIEVLEPIVEADSARRSNELTSSPVRRDLDAFTHNLAELAASAPTTMDNRVCRSVAVKSHSLSEALSPRGCDSGESSPKDDREATGDLNERLSEFSVALGDLTEHIHLL